MAYLHRLNMGMFMICVECMRRLFLSSSLSVLMSGGTCGNDSTACRCELSVDICISLISSSL